MPVRAHAVGDLLDDLPVRPAAFERFENPIQPLDAPLRAREGPFLFQTWTRGEHDIRKAAVVLKKISCTTKNSSLLNAVGDIIGVRVDDAHLLAEKVQALSFPC